MSKIGHKHTAETRRKMSEGQKRRWRNTPPETRAAFRVKMAHVTRYRWRRG